jgi:hypothetical protein
MRRPIDIAAAHVALRCWVAKVPGRFAEVEFCSYGSFRVSLYDGDKFLPHHDAATFAEAAEKALAAAQDADKGGAA